MKKFYFFLVTLFTVNGAIAQWVQQNSSTMENLYSVYFTDANTGYVVGDQNILKTTDGGINWVECVLPGYPSGLTSVHFPNTDTGYVVGFYCHSLSACNGLILSTTDGGTNWVQQSPNLSYGNYYLSVHFPNTLTGYGISWTGGGFGQPSIFRIIKTTDGGSNWFSCHTFPDNSCYLQSVYFINVDTGYLAGDGIRKTFNGGTNWVTQYSNNSTCLNSVYFPSVDTGYAVGYFMIYPVFTGLILKTTDGGTNWLTQYSGTGSPLKSVYFTSVNTGYAVGDSGTILKTTDGGINWLIQNSGTDVNLHSVHFSCVDTGYAVGDSGTILKTTDGGWYVGLTDLLSKSNNLKIYPNPSSTEVTIETPTKGQLSILNLNGQQLLQQEITGIKTQLDISNFSSGVYFLKATGERTVRFGKFFKN